MSTQSQASPKADKEREREEPASLIDHRGADRVQKILNVLLHGRQGKLGAVVVNLSRTGALATITDRKCPRAKPASFCIARARS